MKSFRTEIENPTVAEDIIELEKKINLFNKGKIDDERFRSLRLARGVYGQRQEGVQMIRIKLPYGKVTADQLRRIAAVSDEYSTGNLHITTRQDIQIHYVSLERTPELWAALSKDDITIREACGNTIRNITGSEDAGINPDEPFDISPYAHAMFKFFLRNPICQEMGRKFKISFSSSDKDSGLSYMHDLGFIPKIKNGKRGFKVMLGGGLGSQPRLADVLYDFLTDDQIIPLTEGVLRVFDRYGERSRRMKARMKYLIAELGMDSFMELVESERKSLSYHSYPIDYIRYPEHLPLGNKTKDIQEDDIPKITDNDAFQLWKKTNVFSQKQKGFFSIGVKVQLGNFSSDKARQLADLIEQYAANELRFNLRQNILLRHIKEELLPLFYVELDKLGFANPGYGGLMDITACPGTDTCNLGIAGSTAITKELEHILIKEYPKYLNNKDLFIKISGCMNACGQHNMSPIGFQGMSIKKGKILAPALQVLLGGSPLHNGKGRYGDKLIKIPSKRAPQALRQLLDDYEDHGDNKPFLDYYDNRGTTYFYELLKPLSNTETLTEDELIDWGYNAPYIREVGVGECAGVVIDLVATLFFESEEKLDNARRALSSKQWSNSIYYAYASMINTAKALLLSKDKKTNTHANIIAAFDETFLENDEISIQRSLSDIIYQIKEQKPSETFAASYLQQSENFYQKVNTYRQAQLSNV